MNLLFSFDGRIGRKSYWIGALVVFAIAFVPAVALLLYGVSAGWDQSALTRNLTLLFLPLYYPYAAIMTKRLHDRNKGAVWLVPMLLPALLNSLAQAGGLISSAVTTPFSGFLMLISIVASLWIIIELGLLKGTPGDNDFGPDPLLGANRRAMANAYGQTPYSAAPAAPADNRYGAPSPALDASFAAPPAPFTAQANAQVPRRDSFGQREAMPAGAAPAAAYGAPSAQVYSAAPGPVYAGQPELAGASGRAGRQGLGWLLFSFDGRINRLRYFLAYLGVFAVAFVLIGGLLVLAAPGLENASGSPDGTSLVYLGLTGLVYLPMLWVGLALQVKRWHDRDKSGWWMLIAFVPVVGAFWSLIETFFLAGTPGPNRYGPDSLNRAGDNLAGWADQIG